MADLEMPADRAGAANGAVVEAHQLTRVYGEGDTAVHALRGVTLSVEAAKLTAVMGPSGSGKSTLMHLLAALDHPTEGHVTIAGTRLGELSDTAITKLRREHIGFIFQFFNLVPLLTVEENLLLPLELLGRADARGRAHALALLARVGLADRARAYPDRLSGGEQQRVAVARALVHDPALVLADEPTGNLDADAAEVVLDLLDGLARELGKTVVMATHSREVIGVADRVFLIQQGQLVEQRVVERA